MSMIIVYKFNERNGGILKTSVLPSPFFLEENFGLIKQISRAIFLALVLKFTFSQNVH